MRIVIEIPGGDDLTLYLYPDQGRTALVQRGLDGSTSFAGPDALTGDRIMALLEAVRAQGYQPPKDGPKRGGASC